MSNLMELARRVAARLPATGTVQTPTGEKGDKGEKVAPPDTFSPLSPFSHPDGNANAPVTLSGREPWNCRIALKLIAEADALVERVGVDGRHPALANAAAMVTSAFATRDLETVRFAVSEFAATVRGVARERFRADKTEENGTHTGAEVPHLSGLFQQRESDGNRCQSGS